MRETIVSGKKGEKDRKETKRDKERQIIES